MKKLLLHCCCAPCASHVLDILRSEYDITVLFYNPNIVPKEERDKRRAELTRLIGIFNEEKEKNKIEMLEHDGEDVAMQKNDCAACISHRLQVTSDLANKHNFDLFTTTLTISPHKNAKLINEIGVALSPKYLPADFKKQDGFKKSVELSKKYSIYRQNYCGCEPSLM